MTQLIINTATATQSYSSHSNTLGAALVAATILANAIPLHETLPQHAAAHGWYNEQQGYGETYNDAAITQISENQQFFITLQEAYKKLASEQRDLDPETQSILYSNLWTLYE